MNTQEVLVPAGGLNFIIKSRNNEIYIQTQSAKMTNTWGIRLNLTNSLITLGNGNETLRKGNWLSLIHI